jgi:DNA-binding HxlR family transcriptional regulator
MRWSLKLAEFNLILNAGRENPQHAHALSRHMAAVSEDTLSRHMAAVSEDTLSRYIAAVSEDTLSRHMAAVSEDTLSRHMAAVSEDTLIRENIKQQRVKDSFCQKMRNYFFEAQYYLYKNGLIYKKTENFRGDLPVIPHCLINNVIKLHHDSPSASHQGLHRTFRFCSFYVIGFDK